MYILRAFGLTGLILFAQPSHAFCGSDKISSRFMKTAAALAAAGAGYYWWRTPLEITPHLDNLNALTFTPTKTPSGSARTIETICAALQQKRNAENHANHIEINNNTHDLSCELPENKKTILIYVSGYAGMSGNARYKYVGSGAYAFTKYAKGDILKDIICVTFDGQVNDRRTFNFGQKLDQDCLRVIYTETIERNPDAQIILFGSCKGAVVIQNFISDPANSEILQPVCDAVLESPSLSLPHLAKHVAQNYVPKVLQPLVPMIFRATFPNLKDNAKTLLDTANNVPDHIKVHIACLPHDKTASYSDICTVTQRLQDAGKTVDLFVCNDTTIKHGKLCEVPAFQKWASAIVQNRVESADDEHSR